MFTYSSLSKLIHKKANCFWKLLFSEAFWRHFLCNAENSVMLNPKLTMRAPAKWWICHEGCQNPDIKIKLSNSSHPFSDYTRHFPHFLPKILLYLCACLSIHLFLPVTLNFIMNFNHTSRGMQSLPKFCENTVQWGWENQIQLKKKKKNTAVETQQSFIPLT